MAHHNNTGALGEQMAAEYLCGKGFQILHQNWRHSHWEVDFIACIKNTQVCRQDSKKINDTKHAEDVLDFLFNDEDTKDIFYGKKNGEYPFQNK